MPIAAGEIQFCYTHVSNTSSSVAIESLGGIKAAQIASGNSQNLFDNVSGIESRDGRTEFRCIVIYNSNATIPFENPRVWFNITVGGVTNATGDEVYMALDPVTAGVDITTISVATEQTVPIDPSTSLELVWSQPTSAAPLDVGDIPAGGHKGLWFKRVVQPNAGAYTDNTFSWTIEGEST